MPANHSPYPIENPIEDLDMALARLSGAIICLYIISDELGCDAASPANEAYFACLAGAEAFVAKARSASNGIHKITKGGAM